MTPAVVIATARTLLAIYAALLAIGGVMGFVKAGSKASLVAGVASAIVAAIALGLTFAAVSGFWLGAALAVVLLFVFAQRFLRTRKFMPAGVICLLSAAVFVTCVVAIQA